MLRLGRRLFSQALGHEAAAEAGSAATASFIHVDWQFAEKDVQRVYTRLFGPRGWDLPHLTTTWTRPDAECKPSAATTP